MEWLHKDKHHPIITTSFTGSGIGEADVLSLTGAGLIHEWEVKQSRADYLRDFKAKEIQDDACLCQIDLDDTFDKAGLEWECDCMQFTLNAL